jgi:carboxypeptidase family protein
MKTVPSRWRVGPSFAAAALIVAGAAGPFAGPKQVPPQPAPVQTPVSSSQGAAGTAGAISGTVVDSVTGRPVVGAVVSLADLDDRLNILPRMVTDARGRFVFRQLKPSKGYFLGARRFGYAYTRYGWTAPGQSLTIADIARITLTEGQWVSNISIPLWRLGAINGRVVDERGEPVVGVAVRAFSTRRVSGQPQLVAGPIATTDDRGVYRLQDLDPDRYVVAVLSVQSTVLETTQEAPITRSIGELATGGIGGGRGTTVSAPGIDVDGRHRLVVTNFATPPPPSAGQSRAYPALFHSAARTPAEALPLEIAYGDNRTGVDFQLQPVPAVRVSGKLVAPSGTVPGLLLRLMPAGSERLGFGSEAATTTVDRDGTFTFLNVPEGNYTLLAQASVMDFTTGSATTRFPDAPGFPAGGISVGSFDSAPGLSYLARFGQPVRHWGRLSVSVGQHNIDELIVPLQSTATIRGRIVLESGTKGQGRMLVRAEPADGDPVLGQPSGETRPNDSSFTIDGLLGGRYVLRTSSGLAVVSVMAGGKDVRDTGIDASAGQDIDDVVVTLTDKLATIEGNVQGRPGSVTAVIAFPAERQQWTNYGWRPPRFRTTRAGPTGAFQVTLLPAGEYFLVAVKPEQIDSWTDPAFLAAASIRATRMTLAWGDRKVQDVTYAEIAVK